ncbi:MAG: TonB-dependent receptor [Bacteroidota bacterium]|nr:TonB-dependent receptor [Bacteroidota bacterium]
MRKILTMLTVALTTLSFVSNAQVANGKITGTIIDGSAKTIESATITLIRAKDSSVAKMSVADKTGKYEFDAVPEGKYLVSISAVGHNNGFSETFDITATNAVVSLKTIELVPKPKALNEVTVTAKRPLIEQKLDRTIVNVEASITNAGATAMEVLEKSPGISVDKDGNISLKGKQGVQVYIDGRPSYLAGTDLANYLRNMNASQLDQIEIMTNPPAKYDAAGNSGIINIKTKKTKQFGYNGSLSSNWNQGRYLKNSESFNFNYRKNKVNLFTNLGYSNRTNFQELGIQRKFIEPDTKIVKSLFDQETRIKEHGESINGKIGIDYFSTRKTTLGAVVSGFYNPGTFDSRSDINISNPAGVLQSKTLGHASNERKWKNFSTNLNFRHVFDSTGRELTADADYLSYRSTDAQSLVNSYFNTVGQPTFIPDTLLGNLPQNIKIYSGKADYSHPLKKGAKFEAGWKSSYVKTDNDGVYNNLVNKQPILDSGRSNHFIYKENVNAVYVNYSRPFGKKWSGQFGLRVENTNSDGHSSGYEYNSVQGKFLFIDKYFKRNYTQLFPTAYIQYTANEKNSFVVNYGRRINRPDYEDLNPFIHFLDKYTFEQGNPNLQPQFSHNIELSHTYKGFLTTTLNYSNTTDIISDVLEQNINKNETFVTKSNIASQRQYGVSVAAGGSIKKWWTANLYVNVYNNLFKGIVNNDYVSLSATTGQLNVSNQFKLSKTWSAELGGFYQTASLEGVFKIQPLGVMNLGVSKQVMKGKGTIRFVAKDILYTQKAKGNILYSNIDVAFKQVRDSRQIGLGFTYRFNKGKLKASSGKRESGASDEQGRVKTGN